MFHTESEAVYILYKVPLLKCSLILLHICATEMHPQFAFELLDCYGDFTSQWHITTLPAADAGLHSQDL